MGFHVHSISINLGQPIKLYLINFLNSICRLRRTYAVLFIGYTSLLIAVYIQHLRKMFKRTATNLNNVPENVVKEWLNTFDAVLTDCDGKFN